MRRDKSLTQEGGRRQGGGQVTLRSHEEVHTPGRAVGPAACGGLCERKGSPGQPVFLHYVSGGLAVPLVKLGTVEKE